MRVVSREHWNKTVIAIPHYLNLVIDLVIASDLCRWGGVAEVLAPHSIPVREFARIVFQLSTHRITCYNYLDIVAPPLFIIDADRLMELFSVFLIILIGLELLDTIKVYLKDDVLKVESVILVAIIAVARKVIVWNFEKYSYQELVGLAAMILALATGFFLLKKSGFSIAVKKKESPENDPQS